MESETESAEPVLADSNTATSLETATAQNGKRAAKAQPRPARRMQRENVAPMEC